MNVLITSVGIRGYLVRYFKDALKNKGTVFATDCSIFAPALYDADDFFILPKVTDNNYINELMRICTEKNIEGIVSLNDIELPILVKNKEKFSKKNIHIVISDPEIIDICYDKYRTYNFLIKNDFSAPKTFISLKKAFYEINKGTLKLPVLIKPRYGSASKDISKVNTIAELENEFNKRKNFIIQEFIDGEEYGVDVFNNADFEPVSVFAKKKIKMRAGETDKAISVNDEKIMELVCALSRKLGFYGPADIDIFKRNDGYLVMEINPRFGGGYPLSHALGAGFPEKIISLINKEKIETNYYKYPENILMMKQYEIMIKDVGKIMK